MKSWKYKFLEKAILGQNTNINNPCEVIERCVRQSYKDMLTAGRFYIKDSIENFLPKYKQVLENHTYTFSNQLIFDTSKLFNDNEIIGTENKYVTTFGLSQKLVNMTFKYLYLFEDYLQFYIDFSKCDCPLDSIILSKLNSSIIWSKCTYEQYLDCQNKIKFILSNQLLDEELKLIGNLAYDFLNW